MRSICANPWCAAPYDVAEGWGGLCPACLALADEHLAGMHERAVADGTVVRAGVSACRECERQARFGGVGKKKLVRSMYSR